ncbi:PLP-dependent aminotransferase family protein [Phytopseudomonas daroniae]|uniref:MocR-like pyridoxine biosynthesis transcription factor PdxR n=1 Tax=Phytopseudomonas daroniae TaxID=2487519 RepID=UPI0010383F3B|nr:PLP-dependent aminotransferase family protein [Pseudomonas daroniae]TBU77016.1 PLP-dependent aminotransferase family protein [Pseudomonas daroniae]
MAGKNQGPLVVSLPLGAPQPGESLQRWLYASLREAILSNRLPSGSLLPSTRSLAERYGLARGTVQAAYQQLQSEGYLDTDSGYGTRVCAVLPDATLNAGYVRRRITPPAEQQREAPDTLWVKRLAAEKPIFMTGGVQPGLRPFFPHRGDVLAFPIDLWRKLHAGHLRSSRLLDMLDADPAGLPALRSAISQYLSIARGVQVGAERIVILGSVQQALDLTLRLVVAPGEKVWMEDPGYPGARQLMKASGVELVDVPVDREGMQVEQAVRLAPNARMAYVTPSHQAPLGGELSPARRLALLRWASENGSYIFEDDYDSEYRFVAKPIPALRSMANTEAQVILAGTFSKLLFPSLRIAYVVLPPQLLESFTRLVSLTARHANSLAQAVLADFIAEGHFDRHLRRMRKLYAARAEAFAHAAERHWQGLLEVPPIRAGLDVVCRLQACDELDALARLATQGIDVMPLQRYCVRPQAPGLIMGFAPYDEDSIERGARDVARILKGG